MLNEMTVKKMENLLQEDAFRAQLEQTSCREDVLRLFQEHSIALTGEEFDELGQKGIALLGEMGYIGKDGELGPEMLEMVTGGAKWGAALVCFGLAAASAYIGYPEGTVLMVICGIACLKK